MKIAIPIIDAGHGFETLGKESKGFYMPDGRVILKENNVNEAVCNKLSVLHYIFGDSCHFITNEWYDVSLNERVRREKAIAKEIWDKGKRSFFISIHADAYEKNVGNWGRFYYWSDEGKKIADILTRELRQNNYPIEINVPQKKSLQVLRDTKSPAVLFELGFMTHEENLELLMDENFRNEASRILYNAFQCIEY